MRSRLLPVAAGVAATAVLLGACSFHPFGLGASPTPPPNAAVAAVAPGHESPAAAFAGWLDAAAVGRTAAACTYALPSQQQTCPRTMASVATTLPQGPIHVGDTYVQRNEALVSLVGTICTNDDCRSNSNRRLGLPGNDAGFAGAYLQAVNTDILTEGCQKVGGRWYVDLGGVPTTQPV